MKHFFETQNNNETMFEHETLKTNRPSSHAKKFEQTDTHIKNTATILYDLCTPKRTYMYMYKQSSEW